MPEKRLFGLYQGAQREKPGNCGVVLCYPMGREYLLAHRSFRHLATHLSQAGFPVLRFDFYGCGDSFGSSEEGSLDQWMSDLSLAVNELRRRSGTRRTCLMGLRLGATLALNTATARRDIDSLVLWNPVLSGTTFLNEMHSLHSAIFKHLRNETQDEIGVLGFRLTDRLVSELRQVNAYSASKKPAPQVLVIQSQEKEEGEAFARHLAETGAGVESRFVPFASVWREGLYRSHVPVPVLENILSWIREVNA
jgi:alpha-beta hydrolase superfamily lysophospholipase